MTERLVSIVPVTEYLVIGLNNLDNFFRKKTGQI